MTGLPPLDVAQCTRSVNGVASLTAFSMMIVGFVVGVGGGALSAHARGDDDSLVFRTDLGTRHPPLTGVA